eukprot:gene3654-4558_t
MKRKRQARNVRSDGPSVYVSLLNQPVAAGSDGARANVSERMKYEASESEGSQPRHDPDDRYDEDDDGRQDEDNEEEISLHQDPPSASDSDGGLSVSPPPSRRRKSRKNRDRLVSNVREVTRSKSRRIDISMEGDVTSTNNGVRRSSRITKLAESYEIDGTVNRNAGSDQSMGDPTEGAADDIDENGRGDHNYLHELCTPQSELVDDTAPLRYVRDFYNRLRRGPVGRFQKLEDIPQFKRRWTNSSENVKDSLRDILSFVAIQAGGRVIGSSSDPPLFGGMADLVPEEEKLDVVVKTADFMSKLTREEVQQVAYVAGWVTASFHRQTITEHLALLFVLPHAQNLLTRSDRLPVRGHNAPPRTLFPALTSDSFFCVSRFLEALVDPIRLGNYYATFISRSTYEVLNGHEDFNTCSTERDWVLTDDEIASWLTPARDMYEEWGRNVDIPERLERYLRGEDTPPTDILPIKYRPPGSSKSGKVWAGRVKAKRGDAGREAVVSNAVSYVVVEDDEESENSVSMGADSVAAAQTQAQFMDDHHSNSESQAISSEGGQIDGALDVSRRDALMEGEELLLRRRAVRSARRARNRSGLDELDEEYGASGPAKHGARGSHQMITRNSNKRVVVEADAEAAEDEDENEGVGTGSSSRRRRDHQLVLRDEERRRSASATASSVHPPTARPRTAGRLQIRSAKAIAIENAEQEGLGMPSGLAGGLGLPARGYIDGRRYLNTPHITYGVGIASGVPGQSSDFNASLLLQGRSAVHRPPLTPNSNNSYPNGGYYVQQPMPTGSSPSYPHYATGVPYPNMLGSAAGAPNISHYNNNLDYRLGNKNAHLHHPYYFNSQAFVSGPPRHLLPQPYAPYNARSSLVNTYSNANNYPNVSAGTFDPTAPYRRLAKKASGANGEGFAENVNSSTGTVSNITIGTVGVDGDGGNLYRGNVGSSAGTVSNITIGTAGIGGDGGSRYRGNIGSSAGTVSNISIGTVGIVGDGGNLGRGNIDSSLTTLGPKNVNIVETSAPRSAIVINATENYLKGDYGLQSLPHNRHLPHEQPGN